MNYTINHKVNTTPFSIPEIAPGWTKVLEKAINALAVGDSDGAIDTIVESREIDYQSRLFCFNKLAEYETRAINKRR